MSQLEFSPDKMLSKTVIDMKPSGIRKFFDVLADMKDAVSLGIGEPDFVTPWHIRRAGIRSLEHGHTHYTSNSGLCELREAVSGYLKRRFSLSYRGKDEILITVGGSEAIDLAFRALLNPGDEVLIPEPSFVCYGPCTTLAGGVPVALPTYEEDNFALMGKTIEAAITEKSKMLVLPFPNNPTGAILTREQLEEIAKIAVKHNLLVLSDEIYAELTYGKKHVSIATLDGMWERTILVSGFSKAYAMTGWRLGYVCANPAFTNAMMKIHQYAIMSSPTTSQYAAIDALINGDEDIESMRGEYDQRRRLIVNGFRKMGLSCFEPFGAFYVFPSIKKTGMSSENFCRELLEKEKVAVIPGNAFGECGEGYVRCSYASSIANIKEALVRIERFINQL